MKKTFAIAAILFLTGCALGQPQNLAEPNTILKISSSHEEDGITWTTTFQAAPSLKQIEVASHFIRSTASGIDQKKEVIRTAGKTLTLKYGRKGGPIAKSATRFAGVEFQNTVGGTTQYKVSVSPWFGNDTEALQKAMASAVATLDCELRGHVVGADDGIKLKVEHKITSESTMLITLSYSGGIYGNIR